MEFQSTGLGQRHLDISWEKGTTQLSIEEAESVWGAVLRTVPPWLLEGGGGKIVIIRGETRLPVVWRYFSAMDKADFENILKVALSREAVDFLIRFGGRRKLFFKLAASVLHFFVNCVVVWLMRRKKEEKESAITEP